MVTRPCSLHAEEDYKQACAAACCRPARYPLLGNIAVTRELELRAPSVSTPRSTTRSTCRPGAARQRDRDAHLPARGGPARRLRHRPRPDRRLQGLGPSIRQLEHHRARRRRTRIRPQGSNRPVASEAAKSASGQQEPRQGRPQKATPRSHQPDRPKPAPAQPPSGPRSRAGGTLRPPPKHHPSPPRGPVLRHTSLSTRRSTRTLNRPHQIFPVQRAVRVGIFQQIRTAGERVERCKGDMRAPRTRRLSPDCAGTSSQQVTCGPDGRGSGGRAPGRCWCPWAHTPSHRHGCRTEGTEGNSSAPSGTGHRVMRSRAPTAPRARVVPGGRCCGARRGLPRRPDQVPTVPPTAARTSRRRGRRRARRPSAGFRG